MKIETNESQTCYIELEDQYENADVIVDKYTISIGINNYKLDIDIFQKNQPIRTLQFNLKEEPDAKESEPEEYRTFITFSSDQLSEISHLIDPLRVMLVSQEDDELSRLLVLKSFIGNKFCTSYPYSKAQEFKDKHNGKEFILDQLEELKKYAEQ